MSSSTQHCKNAQTTSLACRVHGRASGVDRVDRREVSCRKRSERAAPPQAAEKTLAAANHGAPHTKAEAPATCFLAAAVLVTTVLITLPHRPAPDGPKCRMRAAWQLARRHVPEHWQRLICHTMLCARMRNPIEPIPAAAVRRACAGFVTAGAGCYLKAMPVFFGAQRQQPSTRSARSAWRPPRSRRPAACAASAPRRRAPRSVLAALAASRPERRLQRTDLLPEPARLQLLQLGHDPLRRALLKVPRHGRQLRRRKLPRRRVPSSAAGSPSPSQRRAASRGSAAEPPPAPPPAPSPPPPMVLFVDAHEPRVGAREEVGCGLDRSCGM